MTSAINKRTAVANARTRVNSWVRIKSLFTPMYAQHIYDFIIARTHICAYDRRMIMARLKAYKKRWVETIRAQTRMIRNPGQVVAIQIHSTQQQAIYDKIVRSIFKVLQTKTVRRLNGNCRQY